MPRRDRAKIEEALEDWLDVDAEDTPEDGYGELENEPTGKLYQYPSDETAWLGYYNVTHGTGDIWSVTVVGGPVYTHLNRAKALRKAQAYVTAAERGEDTSRLQPGIRHAYQPVCQGEPPF